MIDVCQDPLRRVKDRLYRLTQECPIIIIMPIIIITQELSYLEIEKHRRLEILIVILSLNTSLNSQTWILPVSVLEIFHLLS